MTGKWRPVPLSCISSLEPPPAEKLAAIQAISLGQITREIYFDQFPLEQSSPPRASNTVQRRPLTRTTSSSLDEVLQARESGFGESNRIYRRSGEIGLRGEGEERKRDMLALMPSDPPSMDLMELADEDELIEDEDKEDEEYAEPREPREKPNSCVRLGRPSPLFRAVSTDHLGRATSLDILASSSRAKQLISPGPPRAVSGPAGPLDAPRMVEKRSLTPIPMHDSAKRAKFERQGSHSAYPESYSRPRDSFSRSQSAAILAAPPTPQTRTPGLTRSYSFSSTSSTLTPISEGSYHRNLDSHTGKTVYSRDMTSDSHGKRGREETDSEVLDAAKQLLNMLGGS